MTDNPEYAATKEELLARIAAARRDLDALLAGLTPAEMTAGSEPLDWSIKDHLAHLGAWAVGIAALLQKKPRWEAMQLDPEITRQADIDQTNETLYYQHKDRSLAEVQAYFNDCQQQLVDAISRLDYADLLRPYNDYQTHNNPAAGNHPIMDWIMGDSYEHYAEHIPWMQAKIERVRA